MTFHKVWCLNHCAAFVLCCVSFRDWWGGHHRHPGKPQLIPAAGNQTGVLRQVWWCKCHTQIFVKNVFALFYAPFFSHNPNSATGAGGCVEERVVRELWEGHPRHAGPARHLRREGAEEGHEGSRHWWRRPGGDPLHRHQRCQSQISFINEQFAVKWITQLTFHSLFPTGHRPVQRMLLSRYSYVQTIFTLDVTISCPSGRMISVDSFSYWTDHPLFGPGPSCRLFTAMPVLIMFPNILLSCFLAVLVCLLIQPFSAWAWSRSRYRGRYERGREEPAHSSDAGWSSPHTLLPPCYQLCSVNTHIHWLLSSQALIFKMESLHHRHHHLSGEQRWELRGGRRTCWTRCDQPVWGNVTESNILFHNKAESFVPNSFNMCRRLARVASGQMSPLSATSWPPETTCSFRLRSRYTNRWAWVSQRCSHFYYWMTCNVS